MHTLKSIIAVDKPVGVTPLDTIHAFKKTNPAYQNETISYAGRLDPMASGVLLLLVGAENKKRTHYEHLPKTYTFDILFGIHTDSYDILGRIDDHTDKPRIPNTLSDHLTTYKGTITQPYPPYSAKSVQGKPLYWWARSGAISDITIPTHDVTIHDLTITNADSISAADLLHDVTHRISRVRGDFRQQEILAVWNAHSATTSVSSYPVVTCTMTCSGGTYVRSLVHRISTHFKIPAVTLAIRRTSVGTYTLKHARDIDERAYFQV